MENYGDEKLYIFLFINARVDFQFVIKITYNNYCVISYCLIRERGERVEKNDEECRGKQSHKIRSNCLLLLIKRKKKQKDNPPFL